MAKQNKGHSNDVMECKAKIRALLSEYNCTLRSADEWHDVLLYDWDTEQYANMSRK